MVHSGAVGFSPTHASHRLPVYPARLQNPQGGVVIASAIGQEHLLDDNKPAAAKRKHQRRLQRGPRPPPDIAFNGRL